MVPKKLLRHWFFVNVSTIILTWFGTVIIFQLMDTFENLRAYTQQGASGTQVALFLLMRTPDIAYQLLPAAMLIGALLALFRLARHKELTAVEASGLHPIWVYIAPCAIAIVLISSQYYLEFSALPKLRQFTRFYEIRTIEKNALKGSEKIRWKMHDNALWRFETLNENSLKIDRFAQDTTTFTAWHYGHVALDQLTTAGQMDVVVYPPLQMSKQPRAPIPFLVDELRPQAPALNEMPLVQLWQGAIQKRNLSQTLSAMELHLHQRLAWPLLNLSVLLAALPFVPRHGRKASTAIGMLIALFIGTAGWASIVFGQALASSYHSRLGVWLPHLLLTLLGLAIPLRKYRHHRINMVK